MANSHILLNQKIEHSVNDLLEKKLSIEDVILETPTGLKLIPGGSGVLELLNLDSQKRWEIIRSLDALINDLDMNQIDNLQLVYSIIRQESGFYSSAISRTGALGLMQVMPATAKQVTSDLGIKYSKNRLSSDEIYNIKIGSFYFNKLLKKFKGSIS